MLNEKVAIIIRGLPGSGKSDMASYIGYAAHAQGKTVAIHTTDDFHMENDKYVYKPKKASEYHKQNLAQFTDSCEEGYNLVICPNTNILKSQYKPYIEAAEKNGYKVHVIIMDMFDEALAVKRTAHSVPAETIHSMKQNFNICLD